MILIVCLSWRLSFYLGTDVAQVEFKKTILLRSRKIIFESRGRFLSKAIAACFLFGILLMPNVTHASFFNLNFDFSDLASIGSAYTTHIFLHEMGHQIVADDVGAESHRMNFFTSQNGKFYPGVSLYKSIPAESKLPYAAGGERMAGYTFEYALQSYHQNPTTFNKALMFFRNVDFLTYTLMANYIYPDNDMYDPNIIREETGIGKEILLSFAAAKMLLNTYRIFDEDVPFVPVIEVDKHSVFFMLRFDF